MSSEPSSQPQQPQKRNYRLASDLKSVDPRSLIRDVWADNLHEEMETIRQLIDHFPYVSMDTEFPGVVARPIGNFPSSADYHYQTLRCNVDLLKIIQLGITFADEEGRLPVGVCTWQFNFQFNLANGLTEPGRRDDMYAQDSIELLTKSGLDFQRHEQHGIDVHEFGEILTSSGMVLLEDVKWISFHSGYDFGYLLKLLTCLPLPSREADFHRLLQTFFPAIYDIKYLMRSCKNLKGGLQDVADDLQIGRVGPQHQAGSDSLLTALIFFKMRQVFFANQIDDEKYLCHLYGLGAPQTASRPGNMDSLSSAPETGSSSSSSAAGTSTKTAIVSTPAANEAAAAAIAGMAG